MRLPPSREAIADGFRAVQGLSDGGAFSRQLEMGVGCTAVGVKYWAKAQQHFKNAMDRHPNTDAGLAGMYWEGARDSTTHDHHVLSDLALALERKYADTSWAIRASVWKPKERKKAAA